MPQLRQPRTLKDISVQIYVNLYYGACERWISQLYAAAKSSSSDYSNISRSVEAECREIKRSLSDLPHSLLEIISPQLTRKFTYIIAPFNRKMRSLEIEHNRLCTAMFRSVLTPYLYEYHDGTMEFYLTENLVAQTLDSVPGLRTLRLETLESRVVERMLPHLTNLEVFSYYNYCTDEVIKQLGLHCHNLKEIYLSTCRGVTNASVQHLLRLRKLEILELEYTQIDNDHYLLLLSELPIKNIRFSPPHENILNHVADVTLHKISHVNGHVEDISMLAERCQNITHIDLAINSVDLSCLAALTTLRNLRIVRGDYATYNLNAVLTGIGPRLTDLSLFFMYNVNLHDIVTLCHSLSYLSLFECTLLPFDLNTPLDPQLHHFRNLTSLCLVQHPWQDMNLNYIQHYVSLKTIHLASIKVFTVEFMMEFVRSGTLANLEEFCVLEVRPGALTMEALELLIKHCPHLKAIEGLNHCPLLYCNDIQELKRRISAQNLDLQIK